MWCPGSRGCRRRWRPALRPCRGRRPRRGRPGRRSRRAGSEWPQPPGGWKPWRAAAPGPTTNGPGHGRRWHLPGPVRGRRQGRRRTGPCKPGSAHRGRRVSCGPWGRGCLRRGSAGCRRGGAARSAWRAGLGPPRWSGRQLPRSGGTGPGGSRRRSRHPSAGWRWQAPSAVLGRPRAAGAARTFDERNAHPARRQRRCCAPRRR